MKIVTTLAEMLAISAQYPSDQTVGFVPTMGFLHEGHLSLVRTAKLQCAVTIVSIFVNPTQFAPNEDLDSYPRDFEKDQALLEKEEVDILFFPSSTELYPNGYRTYIEVEELSARLCGKSRPTHFKGVTTIVAKLINIVKPHLMFMGEKDFQQVVILEKMLEDLNISTRIVRCPIVREHDGLAMSSRNTYLSPEERKNALCLKNSLALTKELFAQGITSVSTLRAGMHKLISEANGLVDYIEFINPATLESLEHVDSGTRILLAVRIGKTRLIDNLNL